MSHKKEWFKNYVEFENPKSIRIGNGDIIPAVGKGDIYVKAYDGKVWNSKFLSNVLYVPNIKLNLFSTNACLDKGYCLEAKGSECVFKRDGKVYLKGRRENSKLFKLQMEVDEDTAISNVAVKVSSLQTWHGRMCHQEKNHVKKILENQNIKYSCNDFFCEACIMGKQHRMPFVESVNRAKDVGGLVHTDLCGPMQNNSLGGARYMIIFRDDYSNYRYVYCIKSKSDVSQIISRYFDQVEADTGKKVKTLRSDNGSEYVNKEVSDILRKYKVVHQKSTPYTPEHNGRAERDMRTLVEAARSMIHSKGLCFSYWGEAVNNVVFTLNRTGNSPQKNKTPFELWFNKIPDISMLRVFGSDAYVHVPKEKRRKLDSKSKKGVFVGYQENCKGYRVWIPKEKRVEISRNVIIREIGQVMENQENVENSIIHHDIEGENDSIETEGAVAPTEGAVGPSNDSNDEFEDAENENSEASNVHDVPGTDGNATESRNVQDRSVSGYNLRPRKQKELVSETNCALIADFEEPQSYEEAMKSNIRSQWKNAMNEEYESLISNGTWNLVELPPEKRAISNKWVYKIKRNKEGSVERFKARLVVRGFTQKQGIDYEETFSPVAKFTSIRVILALCASFNYSITQFDIKTAFLYGQLDEEIYMHQPVGFSDGSNKVCKLNKSLYGLKQASRCWNKKFTDFLKKFKFKVSEADSCVFIGEMNNKKIILAIYIDDDIIASESNEAAEIFISYLKSEFNVKVFDSLYYLGMEIVQTTHKIFVSQSSYIKKILQKFNMQDAKEVSTPAEHIQYKNVPPNQVRFPYREAVGSLMYLAIVSRPDIAFAVSYASRFMDSYNEEHVVGIKRIFKYLKGTVDHGLVFKKTNDLFLNCYSDSDYAGDSETRHSTSGSVIMLSGGPISWFSKKQQTVALSTTEAEYMAACETVKEIVWVKRLLNDLVNGSTKSTVLNLDNQSTIKLVKNPQFHRRTKHIEVKFHFIREVYESKEFTLQYVPTSAQLADIFTKPLLRQQFNSIKNLLNIINVNG